MNRKTQAEPHGGRFLAGIAWAKATSRLAVLMFATSASAIAAPPDLTQLSRHLSQDPPACVSFDQRRWMADLETELPSTGYFRRQSTGLVWQTLTPIQDRLVLSAENPDLATGMKALLPVLTGLFDGNWTTLEQHFSVTLSGRLDAWQATLSPKDAAIAERLESIALKGDELVSSLEVRFTDGDRLSLALSPLPCPPRAPGA
ncbi:hypothetical protein LCL99_18685 [Halomonas denitrificans]|uniref:LolA family protein n=1 Tax=Halomonas denitrificans TaxID=370769 RepID=UPI001CD6FB9A|nr:LolA-related protein [Halomonas denitrificans]MCA0976500.1 hypothetical protein [Halomonas denitrificans]MEE3216637.1 LolA-related protein [Pseudomonadota bacterium]